MRDLTEGSSLKGPMLLLSRNGAVDQTLTSEGGRV